MLKRSILTKSMVNFIKEDSKARSLVRTIVEWVTHDLIIVKVDSHIQENVGSMP